MVTLKNYTVFFLTPFNKKSDIWFAIISATTIEASVVDAAIWGVFVAIIPEQKSALAVKIMDGAARAAEVAIAGLISELKIIDEVQLEKYKKKSVTNSIDQVIGYMKWLN